MPKFVQIVKQPLPRVASQGSIEDLHQHKRHSLHILANLALHEYLRPTILASEGIQLFMDVLKGKNSDLRNDLGARRTATKGLVNLVFTKRELKLSVLSQLGEEIKQVQEDKADPIIAGLIKTLIQGTAYAAKTFSD